MKILKSILLAMILSGTGIFAENPGIMPVPGPRIEVVFCLDTTGSMSGLIEGAKQKIWSIANRIAQGKPTPEIAIGLVGYRDRGDEYVTRQFDLSDDLDAVKKGSVELDSLEEEELPSDMKGMDEQEREEFLKSRERERDGILSKIRAVNEKRSEYLAEENRKSGAKDSFDSKVELIIRAQAERVGLEY